MTKTIHMNMVPAPSPLFFPFIAASLIVSLVHSVFTLASDGINGETSITLVLAVPSAIFIGAFLYRQGGKDREIRALKELVKMLADDAPGIDTKRGKAARLLSELDDDRGNQK